MISWQFVCRFLIVISLLLFAVPIHINPPKPDELQLFTDYCHRFNKTYGPNSPEFNKRFEAFKVSLSKIDEYNSKRKHDNSAKYGLTTYSDLSEDEFIAGYLNKTKRYRKNPYKNKYNRPDAYDSDRIHGRFVWSDVPLKIDWRDSGIISKVRDQGSCGACWAYSSVQTIEAMNAKLSNLTSLSVQQVIDCAINGSQGCSGGDICNVLRWIVKSNISIETERDYPYEANVSACHMNDRGIHVKNYSCQSYVNDELRLLKWLANKGPTAVTVNALSWQNYVGGVVEFNCDNSPTASNHAIQIVGFNQVDRLPYYIGKNSWGTSFGDGGYVYLAIGNNTCGLANEVLTLEI